jgi:hypothetical protein
LFVVGKIQKICCRVSKNNKSHAIRKYIDHHQKQIQKKSQAQSTTQKGQKAKTGTRCVDCSQKTWQPFVVQEVVRSHGIQH